MANLASMRRGAFDALAASAQAVSITPAAPLARFSFRGRGGAVDLAGKAFGIALPLEACRAATSGQRAALWLGPEEWLLLAPVDEAAAIIEAFARELGAEPHALVEVSHRNTALEITGPKADLLLNTGNPLDLGLTAFPVGMCTRTLLAKAEIVLWRRTPDRFHMEVWRSFGAYVWQYLEEARRGL
jgi:sarcosine oxidase subunit gamma